MTWLVSSFAALIVRRSFVNLHPHAQAVAQLLGIQLVRLLQTSYFSTSSFLSFSQWLSVASEIQGRVEIARVEMLHEKGWPIFVGVGGNIVGSRRWDRASGASVSVRQFHS